MKKSIFFPLILLIGLGAFSCAVNPRCPGQLLPVIEIQINNTASTHDDYINTSSFTSCRARIKNVSNFGSNQNFPGGVQVEFRNKKLNNDITFQSTSGTGSSVFETLPGNGGWFNFSIRGNSTSSVDKSVLFEMATAGVSCNEVVLTRKALMVPSGSAPIPSSGRPQVEIEIGSISHLDDYLTWAPFRGRIKWANPPNASATLDIVLQNMSSADRLRFSNNRPPAESSATKETIQLKLSGDGSFKTFYVSGNFEKESENDKDAVLEILDVSSGNLLAREGVMVRIRKNVNEMNSNERDRYLEAMRTINNGDFSGQYEQFLNTHSRDGIPGGSAIAHFQAHSGSGFLPWHRLFVLHIERIMQASDPSITVPYWHFDQSSPSMFNERFFGRNNPSSSASAILHPSNPISTWSIESINGIQRETPYGDTGIPGVLSEMGTLGLGVTFANPIPKYSDFKVMEVNTHNLAHSNSGSLSWIGGSPAVAPRDPLFYSLHCNVDRLWAKWQWLYEHFDATSSDVYDLQGSFTSPSIPPSSGANRTLGQYVDDSVWPWDNVTGLGGSSTADDRPNNALLTPFPITLGGLFPGSKPTIKLTIDYRQIGFDYDDIYPFELPSWNNLATMNTGRYRHVSAVGKDGTGAEMIFVFSGLAGSSNTSSCEAYNPISNTWSSISNIPTPRGYATAVTVNNKIYVIGGQVSSNASNIVQSYDPATNSWNSSLSGMSISRNKAAAATANGKIYVFGGENSNGGTQFNSVEEYDPVTNSWTTKAAMPVARTNIGAVLGSDGLIYVIGTQLNTPSRVDAYNPATNTWVTKTDMPVGLSGGRGIALSPDKTKIYVINDGNYNSNDSRVYSYDIPNDYWTEEPNSITGQIQLSAATIGNYIYAIGGTKRMSPSTNRVERYGPIN